MIQDSRNKISFNATPANTGDNDVFAIFKDSNRSNAMKPIPTNTTTSNTNLLQTMQKNEQNTNIQQNVNHVGQDTFEKKDKKNVVKQVAIGTSIALLVYSAFALIKYKSAEGSKKIIPRLTEPIKFLSARINPNGFKPSVTIEENEIKYVGKVSMHISRLSKNQRNTYVKQLFEKSTFTEEGKERFLTFFGKYLNQ